MYGGSRLYVAQATDAGGAVRPFPVEWTSTNSVVMTVDLGMATAVGIGSAGLVARYGMADDAPGRWSAFHDDDRHQRVRGGATAACHWGIPGTSRIGRASRVGISLPVHRKGEQYVPGHSPEERIS